MNAHKIPGTMEEILRMDSVNVTNSYAEEFALVQAGVQCTIHRRL